MVQSEFCDAQEIDDVRVARRFFQGFGKDLLRSFKFLLLQGLQTLLEITAGLWGKNDTARSFAGMLPFRFWNEINIDGHVRVTSHDGQALACFFVAGATHFHFIIAGQEVGKVSRGGISGWLGAVIAARSGNYMHHGTDTDGSSMNIL